MTTSVARATTASTPDCMKRHSSGRRRRNAYLLALSRSLFLGMLVSDCGSSGACFAGDCNAAGGGTLPPNCVGGGSCESGPPLGSAAGRSSAGTAGTDVGPKESTCTSRPSPHPSLVRSCVLGNSCDPLIPIFSLSQCVTYDTVDDCVGVADACDEVEACIARRWEHSELCSSVAKRHWLCDGERAVQCDDSRAWSVDCSALGGRCAVGDADGPSTTWPCALSLSVDCAQTAPGYHCAGNARYLCREQRGFGIDCGQLGLVCHEELDGQAYCGAPQLGCDSPGSSSCIGNRVTGCGTSGFAFGYDCTRGGGHCTTDGAHAWACVTSGCAPESELICTEDCVDATVMRICVGGAPYLIDCADYGFTSCMLYADPAIDGTYVGCR